MPTSAKQGSNFDVVIQVVNAKNNVSGGGQ